MKVRLFANLREILGREYLFLEFNENPTLNEIINALISTELRKALIKNGKLDERYKIIYDEAKREVYVLPPVCGG
ncbi:MAG: MoaD/ThiS family protein [Candidatus Methanomethyliaceae archaeon]|nr:MoaD/ThiS family protein [Candidatus Methanomethyliaceae archaeon]MDW7971428.1 MoaD/ThiS family protein [Nitrososphaerota archaeon]